MNKQISIFLMATIVIILIMAGVAFYWFQLRPSQIIKECTANAENKDLSSDYSKYTGEKNFFDQKVYDNCLLEHGLRK